MRSWALLVPDPSRVLAVCSCKGGRQGDDFVITNLRGNLPLEWRVENDVPTSIKRAR